MLSVQEVFRVDYALLYITKLFSRYCCCLNFALSQTISCSFPISLFNWLEPHGLQSLGTRGGKCSRFISSLLFYYGLTVKYWDISHTSFGSTLFPKSKWPQTWENFSGIIFIIFDEMFWGILYCYNRQTNISKFQSREIDRYSFSSAYLPFSSLRTILLPA